MYRLLVLLILLVPEVANSAWVKLGETDQFAFYYDPSNVTKNNDTYNGDTVKLDVLSDMKKVGMLSNGDEYKSSKETWINYCGSNQMRRVGSIFYTEPLGTGSVMGQWAVPERPIAVNNNDQSGVIFKRACDAINLSKKNSEPNPLDKYSNNKIHLILSGIPETFPNCKLAFTLVNKTNFTLSKNAIVGQIVGENINNVLYPVNANYNSISDFVTFESLPPNQSANGTIALSVGGTVCFGSNGQGINEIRAINFKDVNSAVNDGITSWNMIELHNDTGIKPQWTINQSVLNETIKLKNPEYRKLRAKFDSCLDSCFQRMRSCVITYKSAANDVCGMPYATCQQGCKNIK